MSINCLDICYTKPWRVTYIFVSAHIFSDYGFAKVDVKTKTGSGIVSIYCIHLCRVNCVCKCVIIKSVKTFFKY